MARARSTNNTPERDSLLGAAVVSVLLHGLALFGAIVVWPFVSPPMDMPSDIVPVDLLTVAEMTNIQAQVEELKEPEPEKPVETPLPPPEPPQDEQPQEAAAEPTPPPPPEPEKPAPDAEAIEPPKPEPPKPEPPPAQRYAMAEPSAKPKPEKKKKDEFNIDDIMKGIDSTPKATQEAKAAPTKADRTLRAAGAQSALTASEIDALRARLSKCWNVPVGAPDPSQLVFVMQFSLNEDGTVASPPELDPAARGKLSDPYFRAAVDTAKRAIHICGPYDMLPKEKYAGWREIKVEFDPAKMAGY